MEVHEQDYRFDLDTALAAVVTLTAAVPKDAYTAETLGTERAGYGVFISSDGLVLTVGYLVAEAESIWLTRNDGRVVQGHVLSYEYETGFGLVQALSAEKFPFLPLGDSNTLTIGDPLLVAGTTKSESVSAHLVARDEFAGYWEYVLDDALFTQPAHENWGGTAVINRNGELMGIGSLMVQATNLAENEEPKEEDGQNMCIPINFLKPILDDIRLYGHPNRPARPWMGLLATEIENRIVLINIAAHGPARRHDLRAGDLVISVAGEEVTSLIGFFRKVWSMGDAGATIPMQIYRDGKMFHVDLSSADRRNFLKSPLMH